MSHFRLASPDDLLAIKSWLTAERAETGEGFFCNWNIIESAQRDGNLHSLIVGDEVVAFLANERTTHNIVEVHPKHRRKGLGRLIADEMMRQSRAWDLCVVEIACAPESSVPFWQQMGFTPHPTREGYGGGVYAYQAIESCRPLGGGPRVPYVVRYFPEAALWDQSTPWFRQYASEAELLADGSLRLPERACGFHPDRTNLSDVVVEITVEGKRLCRDKTKRDKVQQLGLEFDDNNIPFVDWLILQDV